jgi:hypothetical protein
MSDIEQRLLEEIRLGISLQFDEARIQSEEVIEEHSLALSIEEQLRHSGFLQELGALVAERERARPVIEAALMVLDDLGNKGEVSGEAEDELVSQLAIYGAPNHPDATHPPDRAEDGETSGEG